MKIFITGSAGFIGFHLVKALLKVGYKVTGIDNLNDYYDPQLKLDRLDNLSIFADQNDLTGEYTFIKLDIANDCELRSLFEEQEFDIVINLAAQAGVRYSLENPKAYVESNLVGFTNILECCRSAKIKHFIFASSSSVYGMNVKQPFSTSDNTDYPISLYAATKKSNELLAYSYSHLFQIPTTGLRFFTVYGPYGRPDMAYYKFTAAIDEGSPIDVFNNGEMLRDFTYIDDIIEGILRLVPKIPMPIRTDISNALAPFSIFNIGNNKVVSLDKFIEVIEKAIGKKAIKKYVDMQLGDMYLTSANIEKIKSHINFKPKTSIEKGLPMFVDWYKKFYNKY